jgi:hypothetical protein
MKWQVDEKTPHQKNNAVPSFSQNVNAVNGTRIRVVKYLAPVLIFSVVFNLPKFFEAEIEYVADQVTILQNFLRP